MTNTAATKGTKVRQVAILLGSTLYTAPGTRIETVTRVGNGTVRVGQTVMTASEFAACWTVA